MSLQSLARPTVQFTAITGKNARHFRSIAAPRFVQRRAVVSCSSSQSSRSHQFQLLRFFFFSGERRGSRGDQESPSSIAWHGRGGGDGVLPEGGKDDGEVAVVLLGWLGAQHKHLRKYAEWYNSRGIRALSFVMPMPDLLNFGVVSKADGHVDLIYKEIKQWLSGGSSKKRSVLFHTFSNTGWFFYGAILEKIQQENQEHLTSRIKGCVVDSGPAAELSPQVWASGFATAFLKKQSFSTQSLASLSEAERALLVRPSMPETLMLGLLEKFFALLLSLPAVKVRLLRVISILSSQQPPCPQLYIYSSADRVIPARYVEEFIDLQKRGGYRVSSFNMQLSPHVDHLRAFPALYHEQLDKFLRQILPESRSAAAREAGCC